MGTRRDEQVRDAVGATVQQGRRWPSGGTLGVVTRRGRTFHRDESCAGLRQGKAEAEKKGRDQYELEHVTAAEAQRRDKAPCAYCWSATTT